MTQQESFTKEELQHLMPFLNEVPDCKICSTLRVKLERMIKEYPKEQDTQIGGIAVTRERV